MAVSRYPTAGKVVRQAALELGLGNVGEDPFASTNPAVQQLIGLLNAAGKDLAKRNEWTQLRTEWSFTTQGGDTGIYPLPDDMLDMIDQTGWDRTRRLPLGGPLTDQEWAFVKAWKFGITVTALFRIGQNVLEVQPQPPPAGIELAFTYVSRAWACPAAAVAALQAANYQTLGAAGADEVVTKDDVILYDELLIVKMLKLEFRKAKRLDFSVEQADFDATFERTIAENTAAPVLNLGGPRLGLPINRLIDNQNIPITGAGR